MLVVQETDSFTFVLSGPLHDSEYRIFIGDIPLSELVTSAVDARGVSIGGQRYWPEHSYFESARGRTNVRMESQPEDAVRDQWVVLCSVDVYVLPSKAGERLYQKMASDLGALSVSVLTDLYGKSRQTYDLRCAREAKQRRSREEELTALGTALEEVTQILELIARRPASQVRIVMQDAHVWGTEQLGPRTLATMTRHGQSLMRGGQPLALRVPRKRESFDVPEHRIVRAFLEILKGRASACERAAANHIKAINRERHLRDKRIGEGRTLFESEDLPRIRRLEAAIMKARRVKQASAKLETLAFLQDVPAEMCVVREGVFQRNAEYRALLSIIRKFLVHRGVWYEGDGIDTVTKVTSRLFEQWCYLKIVDAFRACGLDLCEWTDVLRQNLTSRFIVDFNRGLMFEGGLTADLRVRIRYEPWILGERSAGAAGETLCRGSTTDVAWCPDVLIECLRLQDEDWKPMYGIVLDCKYTKRIRAQHWSDTAKYLEIRSTTTRRQIVKQLWLIAPGGTAKIECEDPAIVFDENGPSCAIDEAVWFRLVASSGDGSSDNSECSIDDDVFMKLARGTINFFIRELSTEPSPKTVNS